MKKIDKSIFMASLFTVMSLCASAASINLQEAQARATAFLLSHQPARMAPGTFAMPLNVLHAEPSAVDPSAMDYYVFQTGDKDSGGAFVIVAGDDRANDILGYADGLLDMADLPCGLRWMLDHYKEQMEWLQTNPAAAVGRETDFTASVKVLPLLTCNWNQGEPYNNFCPIYKNQHCITGCIATAMAQVLYYWQYPDVLPDYPAYVTGEIAVPPLPGTTINWDDMLDGYYLFDGYYRMYSTEAQDNAVATLMRYCGQATKMGYGVDASGSGSWNQMSAITDFGYNAGSHNLHRDNYTTADWMSLMLNELTSNRPILYCGYGEAGGHAFVVDGYDGSKFHINWGWEGGGNGYFYLDAFTVYGVYDFNWSQSMIVEVYPNRDTTPCDVVVDGIGYRRNGNELTVTRKDHMDNQYSGNVVIPSHLTVDGVDCVVTAIGNSAFKNCTALRSVTLPETLKRIDKFAFKGCKLLAEVTLPSGLESIDYAAFQDCSGMRTFKFNAGVKHISSYAFFNCGGLKDLYLPKTVEGIDPHAFFGAVRFTSLNIDMECVPDEAFTMCNSLSTVTFGNHVKTIGEGAFAECMSLTQLNMGAHVDSIAPMAFYGCTGLKAIKKLPVEPPLVADVNSFDESNYSKTTLYVPEEAWVDYYSCDIWTLFENQTIDVGNLPGDVNGDAAVNITDVNQVINDILSGKMTPACDVNGDSSVNIADVNYIISIILSAQ